jgi:hypothetical protein
LQTTAKLQSINSVSLAASFAASGCASSIVNRAAPSLSKVKQPRPEAKQAIKAMASCLGIRFAVFSDVLLVQPVTVAITVTYAPGNVWTSDSAVPLLMAGAVVPPMVPRISKMLCVCPLVRAVVSAEPPEPDRRVFGLIHVPFFNYQLEWIPSPLLTLNPSLGEFPAAKHAIQIHQAITDEIAPQCFVTFRRLSSA